MSYNNEELERRIEVLEEEKRRRKDATSVSFMFVLIAGIVAVVGHFLHWWQWQ